MSRPPKQPPHSIDMDKITAMFEKVNLGQDDLKKGQTDIKKDLAGIQNDLKNVQQLAEENKKRVEGVEDKVVGMEKGMHSLQREKQRMEITILNLEMDRMSYYLRFQNIEEETGEDVKDLMGSILAEFVGVQKERMQGDIDQAYRVNTYYARTHDVPREIHVKFLRRETKEVVLRAQREEAFKYNDKEIIILKQIPKKMRENRKKYSFLSSKLYLKGIMFRWLSPEGMWIFFGEEKIRITNTEEAAAFLKKHNSLWEEEGGGAMEGAVGGEDMQTEMGREGARYARGRGWGRVSPKMLRSRDKQQ